MACSKANETLTVTCNRENVLKQVDTFNYLGAVIKVFVNKIINAELVWHEKVKDFTGVNCDKRKQILARCKVHKMMASPGLIYEVQIWTLKTKEENLLERK